MGGSTSPRKPVRRVQSSLVKELTFTSKDECRKTLERHGVDTIMWGAGRSKSIDDLMKEISTQDCILQLMHGTVYRCVGVVKLVVRSPDMPGHHLVCYQQLMADGRVRPRNVLVSEKKKPNELPQRAAMRAVQEELGSVEGIDREDIVIRTATHLHWVETEESPSYPTLQTRYELHQFEVKVRGLPSETFVSQEPGDTKGSKKKHFWYWCPDSEDDLRYKPSAAHRSAMSGAARQADHAKATSAASSIIPGYRSVIMRAPHSKLVAFMNTPVGSATYWPSSHSPRSSMLFKPSQRWQLGISRDAGILTPTWAPASPRPRARSAVLVPSSPRTPCSGRVPTPGVPVHMMPRHADLIASSPPAAEPEEAMVAPAGGPLQRSRHLHFKPSLDEPSTDNGDTTPRSRKGRVRRMAANVHQSMPTVTH